MEPGGVTAVWFVFPQTVCLCDWLSYRWMAVFHSADWHSRVCVWGCFLFWFFGGWEAGVQSHRWRIWSFYLLMRSHSKAIFPWAHSLSLSKTHSPLRPVPGVCLKAGRIGRHRGKGLLLLFANVTPWSSMCYISSVFIEFTQSNRQNEVCYGI